MPCHAMPVQVQVQNVAKQQKQTTFNGEKNMSAKKFIKTLGLLLGLWSLNSQGSAIYFNAIDLNPSVNLWRYEYQIVGVNFLQNEGFDIYFPVNQGFQDSDLGVPTAANSDWDVQVFQPDQNLSHDGFLDGLALAANPSLQEYFTIDFIWRGQGTPGSQKYELYDANANFTVTDSGQTQPFPNTSVPEPATLLLMLVGLGGYLANQKIGKSAIK